MIELSETTKRLIKSNNIQKQLIIMIDDLPLFSSITVQRKWKIGDVGIKIGQDGLKIGGLINEQNQKAYINISGDTTRTISQELSQEKNSSSTVTTINIELVDKNLEITSLLSSGFTKEEVLGRFARCYLSIVGASHPEDSIILLSGIVDSIRFLQSSCIVAISHPSQLSRQDAFLSKSGELEGDINNSITQLSIDDASYFLDPSDCLKTYVRINDEIIEYGSVVGNTFSSCTRASLTTLASSHDDGDDVSPLYRLTGNAFDVALKLYMSGQTESVREDIKTIISNGIVVKNRNAIDEYGIVIGDKITIYDDINAGNNKESTLEDYEIIGGELYLYLSESFVVSLETSSKFTIKSKYDVLTSGGKLDGRYVDVERFEYFRENFNFAIPDIDVHFTDKINIKEFVEKEIFLPCGVYSLPRKGKISCGITIPPYSDRDTIEINKSNIINGSKIKVERSINRYYYNTLIFKYKKDYIDDKFIKSEIVQSPKSINTFGVGYRSKTIEATCFRDGSSIFLQTQGVRFIDRYKNCAEHLKVDVNFHVGLAAEVGDIIIFNPIGAGISDNNTGDKNFKPRLMEIINKSFTLNSGVVTLSIIDTSFSSVNRFASISPSSIVGDGSTINNVVLKLSTSAPKNKLEGAKYENMIGTNVVFHNPDYTTEIFGTIKSIDSTNGANLVMENSLSSIPTENLIMDILDYDSASNLEKTRFAFLSRQDSVVSASDEENIVVSDGSIYFVGMVIFIHNESFSSITDDGVEVLEISGNNLKVENIGFVPDNTFLISGVGFISDNGHSYRIL